LDRGKGCEHRACEEKLFHRIVPRFVARRASERKLDSSKPASRQADSCDTSATLRKKTTFCGIARRSGPARIRKHSSWVSGAGRVGGAMFRTVNSASGGIFVRAASGLARKDIAIASRAMCQPAAGALARSQPPRYICARAPLPVGAASLSERRPAPRQHGGSA
jgi:hypothetical protein